MSYNDHAPPHFHAVYAEAEALFTIDTLQVLRGGVPRRVRAVVVEWATVYHDELVANWNLARQGVPLQAIEPLDQRRTSSRTMPRLVRIRSVTPISGFLVRLELTDGTAREVDLEKYLRGPIFERIRTDPARFCEVTVEPGARNLAWPNGGDIDPDVLYHDLEPAWADADLKATAIV